MYLFDTDEILGCCSAFTIYGFDNINYYTDYGKPLKKPAHESQEYGTDEEFKENIIDIVRRNRNLGICCVFTNQCQRNTNRLLKEMGFHRSKSYENKNHPGSKVRLWWIGVQEFFEKNT